MRRFTPQDASNFYNNSKESIGEQSIQNCSALMDEIQEDWTTQPLLGDELRSRRLFHLTIDQFET